MTNQRAENRDRPVQSFFADLWRALRHGLTPPRLGDLLVRQGHVSPERLRHALTAQQLSHDRLGAILLQQDAVSRRALYKTLMQQWTLRSLVAALTFIISISGNFAHTARAGTVLDVPSEISLVDTSNHAFNSMRSYPNIFGTTERESANITPFIKWTGMFQRFESDLHNPRYRGALREWQASLRPLIGRPLEEQADAVNTMMNDHTYVEDEANWHVSDYWETPLEFLTRNGDCEDFAIAKYASLRMLGVPEDHLRIAIVKDLEKGVAHAILVLYTNNGNALILDNQNSRVVEAEADTNRYQIIFSINRQAWWLHKSPSSTLVASAQ